MGLLEELQAGLVVWRESLSPQELALAEEFQRVLEQTLAAHLDSQMAKAQALAQVSPQALEALRQALGQQQEEG